MTKLTLTQAMAAMEEGQTVWCRPRGYRGWFVALSRGNLYEEQSGAWYRCKKGVSTILGADWFVSDPEVGGSPPAFKRAHYESESFMAYEARLRATAAEEAVLRQFDQVDTTIAALRVVVDSQRERLDILMEEIQRNDKDTRDELAALRREIRALGPAQEPAG